MLKIGLGDWIMATADARDTYEKYHVRCVFGDGETKYWDSVFERNPIIAKDLLPNETFAWVTNYPSRRPYIKQTTENRFIFDEDFKIKSGELYPSNPKPKSDYVIIEPNFKKEFLLGQNKDWGLNNWQNLANKLDCELIQFNGIRKIKNARIKHTQTFQEALNWLSGARLLITTDGALHHAAAALGIPAIVLWGGVCSPNILGYDSHINIWHGDEPCGTHSSVCTHCQKAMAKITVEEVLEAYERT